MSFALYEPTKKVPSFSSRNGLNAYLKWENEVELDFDRYSLFQKEKLEITTGSFTHMPNIGRLS